MVRFNFVAYQTKKIESEKGANMMKRFKKRFSPSCLFYSLCFILIFLSSCARNPIIIPEYENATEQFIFAKGLKDNTIILQQSDLDEETRKRALKDAFRSVIERFPDDRRVTPLAWVELAELHYRQEEFKEALEIYNTVLENYPDQDDVVCQSLYGLGRCHDQLGNYKKALSFYKECYKRFENDPRPHLNIIAKQAKYNYSRIRVK